MAYTPALTYGDIPLLFDYGRVAQDFIDRYQPLHEFTPQGRPQALQSARMGPRDERHIGLPEPNYPPYPQLRINELYWPTGASRWALGFFLVDTAGKEQIEALPATGDKYLIHNDGSHVPWWKMEVLTFIPVSSVEAGNNLWIMVLVDVRWWLQFVSVGDLSSLGSVGDPNFTWTELFTELHGRVSALEFDVSDIPAAYLIPDRDSFKRKYENLAVMMDAAAESVGMRYVFYPAGFVFVLNEDDSRAEFSGIDPDFGDARHLAGGMLPVTVPAYLQVIFPRIVGCCPTGEVYTYTIAASDHITRPDVKTVEYTQTILETAYADGETGTPANSAALIALADQIGADYYAYRQLSFDMTFAGLSESYLSGLHDAMIWSFGQEIETTPEVVIDDQGARLVRKFEYRHFTRHRSMPMNFGVGQLLHQDSTLKLAEHPPGCEVRLAVLTSELAQGSSATAREFRFNDSDTIEYVGEEFTVWDWQLNLDETVPVDTKFEAHWMCDRYVVMNPYCDPSDTLPA